MHFTLNRLAEGRALNKELLKIFISYKIKNKNIENFWHENSYGNDLLDQYCTNTWYTEELINEFKEFCEPVNLIKAIIINETFIRGIELEVYEKEFEAAGQIITEIFSLTNQNRKVYNTIT